MPTVHTRVAEGLARLAQQASTALLRLSRLAWTAQQALTNPVEARSCAFFVPWAARAQPLQRHPAQGLSTPQRVKLLALAVQLATTAALETRLCPVILAISTMVAQTLATLALAPSTATTLPRRMAMNRHVQVATTQRVD